jgi:hypothetical protein
VALGNPCIARLAIEADASLTHEQIREIVIARKEVEESLKDVAGART